MPYNNYTSPYPPAQGYAGGMPYQQGQGYGYSAMQQPQGIMPQQQIQYPQMPPIPPQLMQSQPQQENMILDWVQGREAASAYYVPKGKGAILMDINRRTFYLVSRGEDNMPRPMQTFDYYQRPSQADDSQQVQQPDYIQSVDYADLDRRLKALESTVQTINASAQPPMLPAGQPTQPQGTRMIQQTEEHK